MKCGSRTRQAHGSEIRTGPSTCRKSSGVWPLAYSAKDTAPRGVSSCASTRQGLTEKIVINSCASCIGKRFWSADKQIEIAGRGRRRKAACKFKTDASDWSKGQRQVSQLFSRCRPRPQARDSSVRAWPAILARLASCSGVIRLRSIRERDKPQYLC